MPGKEISSTEMSIIKNMMLSRSYKDIAQLLARTTEEIGETVLHLTEGTAIITHQKKLDDKKVLWLAARPRKEKVLPAAKQKSSEGKTIAQQEKVLPAAKKEEKKRNNTERFSIERQREMQRRQASQTLPTKHVDYTKLVSVRIDRQTMIYAEPGKEEEAKRKFLKTYVKPIDRI